MAHVQATQKQQDCVCLVEEEPLGREQWLDPAESSLCIRRFHLSAFNRFLRVYGKVLI